MLVSATEMLNKAKAGHYAVGQFNINNLEWTKMILQAAQENDDLYAARHNNVIDRINHLEDKAFCFKDAFPLRRFFER